jgi:hypothetical protein
MLAAPNIKRLVDLVDRDQVDEVFYPYQSQNTLFNRKAPRAYHNMVPEIVEIGYQGNAAWGQRITVTLTRQDSGDMLQWLCLRLAPRSWLGGDLDAKMQTGLWSYQDPDFAWTWAPNLGTAAIQRVEFEIGDAVVETWPGEWMDVWSRTWLDGGRAGTWDTDIYARGLTTLGCEDAPPLSFTQPTEDGYIYCWLPLALLRRPQTAFPLAAMGEQEVRVHIILRPFNEVVGRVSVNRVSPTEVPLGETIVLLDETGDTAIPWSYTLPDTVPGFEDVTVFVGVSHMEDPLRRLYMRLPMEIMYEPVTWSVFSVDPTINIKSFQMLQNQGSTTLSFSLRELIGPIREISFFLRRVTAWKASDWTTYDSPLVSARLMVGNSVWRDEAEQWWRIDYGLAHRGGIRLYNGYVYGTVLGAAADWTAEDLQPAGTVNASRADLRLDLTLENSPVPWQLYVFGVGVNWLRFARGLAVPLFRE